MTKPTVFNYQDYECLKEENLKLKEQIANLEIRCRIAEADMPAWISVSEKLPSNNGCVLVTIDDSIEFGKCEDGEWSIWVCEHWDEWDAKGGIAWMPLPDPYKEEQS